MTLDEMVNGLSRIKGVIAAAVVDYGSGMMMASHTNDESFDLEAASAGCVNIIHAKMKTVAHLELDDELHDIQISLHNQIHLICPCTNKENIFVYLVADRKVANLSICRRSLFSAEKLVEF